MPVTYIDAAGDVADLYASATSTTRSRPIVLISSAITPHGPRQRFAPKRVAAALPIDASIYVLSPQAERELCRLDGGVGSTVGCYGGALRIVGVGGNRDHLMLGRTPTDVDIALERIPERFAKAQADLDAQWHTPTCETPLTHTPTLPAGITPATFARSVSTPEPEPEPAPTPAPVAAAVSQSAGLTDLEMLRRRVNEQERMLDDALTILDELRAEMERRTRLLNETRTSMRVLTKTVRALEASLNEQADDDDTEAVFSDPSEQLRYDIERAWLHRTPESDRPTWALREYTFGESFVDTVIDPKFTIATRAQVLAAIVDVVTRRAFEVNSRAVHPAGAAGVSTSANQRHDKAVPYRASITTSAGGARIMWWEKVDGSVELMKVAHHDDFDII